MVHFKYCENFSRYVLAVGNMLSIFHFCFCCLSGCEKEHCLQCSHITDTYTTEICSKCQDGYYLKDGSCLGECCTFGLLSMFIS